jgi:hypothetical protein
MILHSEHQEHVYSTHPANTVLKLEPDGTRITIAGPEEEWNLFFHFFCTLTIPPSQKLPPRSTSYEVGSKRRTITLVGFMGSSAC